jgi:hypothetical protein
MINSTTKQSSLRMERWIASHSLAMALMRHTESHIEAICRRSASLEGSAHAAGLVLFAQGLTNLDITATKKLVASMLG